MKHFNDQDYYELLEVAPDASLEDITVAYQSAQEAFSPDSVAIYSLFDVDEEREALLNRIRDAYRTLSNGRTRREYDRQLCGGKTSEPGETEEEYEEPQPDPRRKPVQLDPRWELAQPDPCKLVEPPSIAEERIAKAVPLPSLVRTKGIPLQVEPGEGITGQDLVRLRESRGVSLSDLADRIRVNRQILKILEADQHDGLPALIYVSGFLRAYAQALKLDPSLLTKAYIHGMKDSE